MDKSAIDAITELSASDTTALSDADFPAIVIPGGSSLESLEHLQLQPNHLVSHYTTHVLTDFINYSIKQLDEFSVTYIDTDTAKAVTIFDHGDKINPLWGRHRASLKLQKTPSYKALIEADNQQQSQIELIDFFIDWESAITFQDENSQNIPFKTAINRIRKLSINTQSSAELEQGDFKSKKSAMESVDITSGQDTPPASFFFTASPHDGFEHCKFLCNIRTTTHGDDVRIKYRIIGLDSEKENIANEFKDKIIEAMPDASIYLGTVEHRA